MPQDEVGSLIYLSKLTEPFFRRGPVRISLSSKGVVLASTVVQFLQAMTGHCGGQDKLIVLKHMLDPEDRDLPVDRETFHTTMRKWIAQCSQDG